MLGHASLGTAVRNVDYGLYNTKRHILKVLGELTDAFFVIDVIGVQLVVEERNCVAHVFFKVRQVGEQTNSSADDLLRSDDLQEPVSADTACTTQESSNLA